MEPADQTPEASAAPRSQEQARLHGSYQNDRHYLAQMVALDGTTRSSRLDAIMALKGSIDKSSSSIQSHNAQLQRKKDKTLEKDALQFQELLSQGKNPYEVARTRQVQETAQKERTQIDQRIQDQQIQILKHLEVEKVWQNRQNQVLEKQRLYNKKYQQEMGKTASEARTKQYLVSRTGKETMDPSGKAFRIFPSQETVLKDRSFGTGKNLVHDATQRHAIVEKVARKKVHRGYSGGDDGNIVQPSGMLLPRYGEEDEDHNPAAHPVNNNAVDHAEDRASRTPTVPAAAVPGHELQQLHHGLLDNTSTGKSLALPPIAATRRRASGSSSSKTSTATTDPTTPSEKPGFGKPHRSVLEQKMLTQARESQKQNIFQKQIVWGKEFAGNAFLADPPSIVFTDFEVGVSMTRKFTLTNVSNTFNQFKFLELNEEIVEFFDIKYMKPGRMSAGMSCTVEITFTAVQAKDLEVSLDCVAPTGPFSIPIQCLCKKAIPVVVGMDEETEKIVVFPEMVAGEKQVKCVVLENRGAIPVKFRVRQVGRGQQGTVAVEVEDVGEEEEEQLVEVPEDGSMDGEQANLPPGDVVEAATATDAVVVHDESAAAVDGRAAVPDGGEDPSAAPHSGEDEAALGHAIEETEARPSTSSVGLTSEEQTILDHAHSVTLCKPEGADVPIRVTPRHGSVAAYSSSTISFTFTPSSPMEISNDRFIIDFSEAQTTHRASFWASTLLRPIQLSLSAQATRVPIYLQQQILDFQCCLYDHLYRSQVDLCNRGHVALKIHLRVPKPLEDCVEFHPKMGFVQGHDGHQNQDGKFTVQIKFRPNQSMWKQIQAKHFGSRTRQFMAVPIQVIVPDQVIPVYFVVMARLSASALVLTPRKLDFGHCPLGHSVCHTLQIQNTSRLPQKLSFLKLPAEIRLTNPDPDSSLEDGMETLLPGQEKRFLVVYQPNASATTLSTKLLCKTSMNEEYSVAVRGECNSSPLVFSHTVVHLGATQAGQKQTFSISCTNNSDKPQTMELVVPALEEEHTKDSLLRVTPSVATLAPRQSIRVEIEFLAKEELFEVEKPRFFEVVKSQTTEDTHAMTMTSEAYSITVRKSQEERTTVPPHLLKSLLGSSTVVPSPPPWLRDAAGIPGEPRSVHLTWTVLCFQQQQAVAQLASSVVAFQVATTVVDATVFATPEQLDFGQVAIGQTLVKELLLTNNSEWEILFKAKPLHALGGFRMVNSLQRVVKPQGGQRVIKIEFTPQAPLLYEDELELFCPEIGILRVPFHGEGVNPSLSIQPPDGLLDFKDILARNRATSEFQFTNASTFPLTFRIVPLQDQDQDQEEKEKGTAVPVTSSGLPSFTFSPSEATIPAQATLVVKVLFFPDHQRPRHYRQQYRIQVPNESERHVVTLTGRCWENQLYVFNPHEADKLFVAPPVEDLFDVPPSVNLTSLLGASGAGGGGAGIFSLALAAPGIKKAASSLTVVFDGDTGASETKSIFVGGTLPPAASSGDDEGKQPASGSGSSSAGSFEFVVEENVDKPQYAKMFTLEPMKGTLSVGQQLPVQLTYQPQVPSPPSSSGDGQQEAPGRPELVVSQWIQVRVTCTLKGGALWRHLPAQAAASSVTGAAASGKAAAPTSAASAAGSNSSSSSSSGDGDTRTVQLVLRAKMQT